MLSINRDVMTTDAYSFRYKEKSHVCIICLDLYYLRKIGTSICRQFLYNLCFFIKKI